MSNKMVTNNTKLALQCAFKESLSHLSFRQCLRLRLVSNDFFIQVRDFLFIKDTIDMDTDCPLSWIHLQPLAHYCPNIEKIILGFSYHDFKYLCDQLLTLKSLRLLVNTNTYKFRYIRRAGQQLLTQHNIVHDIPTKLSLFNECPSMVIRHIDVCVDELQLLLPMVAQLSYIHILTLGGFDKLKDSHTPLSLASCSTIIQSMPYLHTCRFVRKSNGTEILTIVLNQTSDYIHSLLVPLVHSVLGLDPSAYEMVEALIPLFSFLEALSLQIHVKHLAALDQSLLFFPHLNNLSLAVSGTLMGKWVPMMLEPKRTPNLTCLSFIIQISSKSRDHTSLSSCFPSSLRYLRLADTMDHDTCQQLAQYCPRLVEIDVDGSVASAFAMLLNFKYLRRLGQISGDFRFNGDPKDERIALHPLQLVDFTRNVYTTAEDLLLVAEACPYLTGVLVCAVFEPRSSLLCKDSIVPTFI
ncbi:hypothetical protein RCL1_003610 [Eukaryota sp. TZLM3-RCL]